MHKSMMQEALKLAWQGRGQCAPNPSVGAVIARGGKILATGWHAGAGELHAEQVALNNAEGDLQGATLYVTLEPCNHWGKTPPCVDAIVASGISQVIYAYKDPNPIVSQNATPERLKEYGIRVVHMPCEQIDAFYQSYSWWMQHKTPWVSAKMAQTLDGKIARKGNQPVALSNASCNALTHQQRWHSDIILTTAQTVHADNPSLDARIDDKTLAKPLAVIDSNLSLTGQETIFTKAKNLVVFHKKGLAPDTSLPRSRFFPVDYSEEGLNLLQVMGVLGELGYHEVWLEAGGRLFTAMHQQRLVKRTLLYLVPDYLGCEGVNAFHGANWLQHPHTLSWQTMQDNMLLTIHWLED